MSSIVGTLAARKFHLSDDLPVSLSHICEINNIEIRVGRLADIAGYYMERDGRRIIVVNGFNAKPRRRFSVAHELGHVVLRHGPVKLMMSGHIATQPNWQEAQANAFAAELLMPKLALARMGVMTPRQIAQLCGVSMEAATIRAEQLGWVAEKRQGDKSIP